jgi:hypothetical protein
MKRLLLLVGLLLVVPTHSYAEGPSFEKTLEFLNTWVRDFPDGNRSNRHRFDKFSSKNRCLLRGTSHHDNKYQTTYGLLLDLSKLDPSRVAAWPGSTDDVAGVRLHCLADSACVTVYKDANLKTLWSREKHTDFPAPTVDRARRVAKAFAHLIRLCGGKEELF